MLAWSQSKHWSQKKTYMKRRKHISLLKGIWMANSHLEIPFFPPSLMSFLEARQKTQRRKTEKEKRELKNVEGKEKKTTL